MWHIKQTLYGCFMLILGTSCLAGKKRIYFERIVNIRIYRIDIIIIRIVIENRRVYLVSCRFRERIGARRVSSRRIARAWRRVILQEINLGARKSRASPIDIIQI